MGARGKDSLGYSVYSRLCASPPESGILLRAVSRNLTAAEAETATLP